MLRLSTTPLMGNTQLRSKPAHPARVPSPWKRFSSLQLPGEFCPGSQVGLIDMQSCITPHPLVSLLRTTITAQI